MALRTPGLAMIYIEACIRTLAPPDRWTAACIEDFLADLVGINLCITKESTRGFRESQQALGAACKNVLRNEVAPFIPVTIQPAAIHRLLEIQHGLGSSPSRGSHNDLHWGSERQQYLVSVERSINGLSKRNALPGLPTFPSSSPPWLLLTLNYSREVITALSRWIVLVPTTYKPGDSTMLDLSGPVLGPSRPDPFDKPRTKAEYLRDALAAVKSVIDESEISALEKFTSPPAPRTIPVPEPSSIASRNSPEARPHQPLSLAHRFVRAFTPSWMGRSSTSSAAQTSS